MQKQAATNPATACSTSSEICRNVIRDYAAKSTQFPEGAARPTRHNPIPGIVATESLLSAWAECSRFIRENETDLIHLDDERAGCNFWLTRNAHGAGFQTEQVISESAEIAMQQLTRASDAFGEVDLYIGDDCNLHFSNERSIV